MLFIVCKADNFVFAIINAGCHFPEFGKDIVFDHIILDPDLSLRQFISGRHSGNAVRQTALIIFNYCFIHCLGRYLIFRLNNDFFFRLHRDFFFRLNNDFFFRLRRDFFPGLCEDSRLSRTSKNKRESQHRCK